MREIRCVVTENHNEVAWEKMTDEEKRFATNLSIRGSGMHERYALWNQTQTKPIRLSTNAAHHQKSARIFDSRLLS